MISLHGFIGMNILSTGKLTSVVTAVILDSISDGVFTVDHQWRVTSFNKAAEKITGMHREDAVGKYCWEVFRSNLCESDCALKKTMRQGKSHMDSSTTIRNSREESIPISVSTALLQDEAGKVLGGVETFRDISLINQLKQELVGNIEQEGMISRSREMQQIFSLLGQIAGSDSSVLIEGETGTGKELLARAIHRQSNRKDKSFVAINCGALPDTLLESELFGYKKGAFTGAQHNKQGLFASAGSGTILLDEIGETSPAFQVKLLRVLEEGEYQPLGSVTPRKTDARIIAATNRDLAEMVKSEHFRKDLFYRINIIHLKLPPLRQRTGDIPVLTENFIKKMNTIKERNINGITPEALALLTSHNYPGNIRELENIIEHAFVLCKKGAIDVRHLPAALLEESYGAVAPYERSERQPLKNSLSLTEKQLILKVLEDNGYNRTVAARKLGMNKSTLYRKMKRLNIELPSQDGRFTLV